MGLSGRYIFLNDLVRTLIVKSLPRYTFITPTLVPSWDWNCNSISFPRWLWGNCTRCSSSGMIKTGGISWQTKLQNTLPVKVAKNIIAGISQKNFFLLERHFPRLTSVSSFIYSLCNLLHRWVSSPRLQQPDVFKSADAFPCSLI